MSAARVCPLEDLGLLRFRGPDTRAFLQGQLSNDVSALRAGVLLRAGLHTPQGRTVALLTLTAGDADDEILAVLPRELLASVASTLARYVLRSKVKISDASAEQRIYGVTLGQATLADKGSRVLSGYASERGLLITHVSDLRPAGPPLSREDWQALDIEAGLPQVYLATSGQFVAQMLNLDCIDAVSFNKGCYTGQEVIARAHYRGRVKRRMQRFISAGRLRLSRGQSGQLADGRAFRIVDVVERVDGRCEFLAIAPLALATNGDGDGAQDASADTARNATSEVVAGAAAAGTPIEAEQLTLPYALPE